MPAFKPLALLFGLTLAILSCTTAAFASTLTDGFFETSIGGLTQPTALAFADDGRIFVCEKFGSLRVIDAKGTLVPTPVVTVSVNGVSERGLTGVALDPDFATNHYIYLYYTTSPGSIDPPPTPKNRLSRFTLDGNLAVPGSETIILDLIPSDSGIHNSGQLRFASDGTLYISTGDGGTNRENSQDLTSLAGKILRINSDGSIPVDNPFANNPTPGLRKEIWAYGFRNPWRFAFQPGTEALFITDVGQDTWEEVDVGVPGGNFGWPIMEGPACFPPGETCSTTGLTLPLYAYSPSPSRGAIIGAAFYDGTTFPAEYHGNFFFADYTQFVIRRLVLDELNNVLSTEVFATAVHDPVTIEYHDESLWYLSFQEGQLTRISYSTSGNRAPLAVASSSVHAGSLPLSVSFSSAGTTDPDNDTLTYRWEFGDGQTSTQPNPTHVYSGTPRTTTVRLTVTDDGDPALSDTSPPITIYLGDQPPTATITSPVNLGTYNAGQTIAFSGTGVDPEDGVRPASAFTWRVVFHHADHIHPFLGPLSGVTGGSFVVPDRGEASTDVWYEILLTVTDSQGAATTTSTRINPNTTTVTLDTLPRGLNVKVDGAGVGAAYTFPSVVGFRYTLDVPLPQTVENHTYSTFSGWSDGGARMHDVAALASPTTFTAHLVADDAPTRVPVAGDWNATAGASVGLFFRQTGFYALRNSNTPGFADLFFSYGPSNTGWVALSGDWDGNGTKTVGLYDPATSTFFLKNANTPGAANLVYSFGPPGSGWTPIVGDWDGDGDDNIGFYVPATGAFFLRFEHAGGAADLVFFYGVGGGVQPVVGDWNNDGVDTIGLYDPATSAWFLRNSNSGGAADLTFFFGAGGAGWTPISGDWNGANGDSIGLYDGPNGAFFLRDTNSTGMADLAFVFGPSDGARP